MLFKRVEGRKSLSQREFQRPFQGSTRLRLLLEGIKKIDELRLVGRAEVRSRGV